MRILCEIGNSLFGSFHSFRFHFSNALKTCYGKNMYRFFFQTGKVIFHIIEFSHSYHSMGLTQQNFQNKHDIFGANGRQRPNRGQWCCRAGRILRTDSMNQLQAKPPIHRNSLIKVAQQQYLFSNGGKNMRNGYFDGKMAI